jgi:FtsP/CotA-like multicopper oxidase with cupredoxin domain
VAGAAFRVAALDGHDLHEPGELRGTPVTVPAGGRADLTYVQPAHQVRLDADGAGYTTGSGPAPAAEGTAAAFDLTAYGTPDPAATPPGRPTVRFTATVTTRIGWYDGRFGARNEINGRLFPAGDMLMVREGDVVEVTVVNRSFQVHPMHLHGHTFTVVRSGGRAVTGSPVRLDTLNVAPGTEATVVFRADNPGLWMFHCHNLLHAAAGMDLMVGYAGVGTPFRAGPESGNDPE